MSVFAAKSTHLSTRDLYAFSGPLTKAMTSGMVVVGSQGCVRTCGEDASALGHTWRRQCPPVLLHVRRARCRHAGSEPQVGRGWKPRRTAAIRGEEALDDADLVVDHLALGAGQWVVQDALDTVGAPC